MVKEDTYQPQAANPIPKTEAELEKAIREGKAKPMTAKETFDFLGLESFEAEIGYRHLIETEDMPTLGKTAYWCKEHPEIWDTSLRSLEISHFIPKHGEV
jgi:hypothetical protein